MEYSIYIFHIYIYIYIYIFTCIKSQIYVWLSGGLCNWARDVRLHILVLMNQKVLHKLSKDLHVSVHRWSTTHRLLKISQTQNRPNIYIYIYIYILYIYTYIIHIYIYIYIHICDHESNALIWLSPQ